MNIWYKNHNFEGLFEGNYKNYLYCGKNLLKTILFVCLKLRDRCLK